MRMATKCLPTSRIMGIPRHPAKRVFSSRGSTFPVSPRCLRRPPPWRWRLRGRMNPPLHPTLPGRTGCSGDHRPPDKWVKCVCSWPRHFRRRFTNLISGTVPGAPFRPFLHHQAIRASRPLCRVGRMSPKFSHFLTYRHGPVHSTFRAGRGNGVSHHVYACFFAPQRLCVEQQGLYVD